MNDEFVDGEYYTTIKHWYRINKTEYVGNRYKANDGSMTYTPSTVYTFDCEDSYKKHNEELNNRINAEVYMRVSAIERTLKEYYNDKLAAIGDKNILEQSYKYRKEELEQRFERLNVDLKRRFECRAIELEQMFELRNDQLSEEIRTSANSWYASLPQKDFGTCNDKSRICSTQCAICYEPMWTNPHLIVTLSSCRIYCKLCITEWLKQSKNDPVTSKPVLFGPVRIDNN
jgi:hypothetical protein